MHAHCAQPDLPGQGLVGAQLQLLTGLTARVEGARDLGAAEGAGVQQPAILAGERHTLGHALVDDVPADLGQPVDVGLARPEVTALDRVIEQAEGAIAVVAIVLGGVDAALGGDAMGPAGTVLVAEALDVVAQLGQRGRGGRTGQSGANDQDRVLALVGGIDQLHIEPVLVPLLLDGAGRHLAVQRLLRNLVEGGRSVAHGSGGLSAFRFHIPHSRSNLLDHAGQDRDRDRVVAHDERDRRHHGQPAPDPVDPGPVPAHRLKHAPDAVEEVHAQRRHMPARRRRHGHHAGS